MRTFRGDVSELRDGDGQRSIRFFREMYDWELDEMMPDAISQIVAAGGEPKPSMLRRLLRNEATGQWLMAYRVPLVTRERVHCDFPHSPHSASESATATQYGSISEVVALLGSYRNPEHDIERRERL